MPARASKKTTPSSAPTAPADEALPVISPAEIAAAGRSAFAQLVLQRSSFFARSQYDQGDPTQGQTLSQTHLNKALARACANADAPLALSLIAQGADVNWRADSSSCAVFKAAGSRSHETLSALFENGARYPKNCDLILHLNALDSTPSPSTARSLFGIASLLAQRPDFSLSHNEKIALSGAHFLMPPVLLAILESPALVPELRALSDETLGRLGASLAIDNGAFELAQRLLGRAASRPWTNQAFDENQQAPVSRAIRADRPEALFFLMEQGFTDRIAQDQWRVATLVSKVASGGVVTHKPALIKASFLSWCLLQGADRCAYALARVPALAQALQAPNADDLSLIFSLALSNEQVHILLGAGFDAKSVNPDGKGEPWIQRLCRAPRYYSPPSAGIEAALKKDPSLAAQTNANNEDFLTAFARIQNTTGNYPGISGTQESFRVLIDKINIRAGIGSKRGSKSKRAGRL